MHVGVMKVTLRLPENQSLKGKRRTIKSLSSRVMDRYNVAIAEVDDNDTWQIATLGVTCVSNSNRHADEVLSRVLGYVEASREDIEVVNSAIETLSGF